MDTPLYLGSDGLFHLSPHGQCQNITIPLPLAFVLTNRCHECGDPAEYEEAVRELEEREAKAKGAWESFNG